MQKELMNNFLVVYIAIIQVITLQVYHTIDIINKCCLIHYHGTIHQFSVTIHLLLTVGIQH